MERDTGADGDFNTGEDVSWTGGVPVSSGSVSSVLPTPSRFCRFLLEVPTPAYSLRRT